MLLMNEFGRDKEDVAIIALSLAAVLLIFYAIYNHRAEIEMNNIIHNTTFTGTVVGKETTMEGFGLAGPRFTVHRLHIIGEYFENSERIEVDHVFVVSAQMYHRFEIGDIINGKRSSRTPICKNSESGLIPGSLFS